MLPPFTMEKEGNRVAAESKTRPHDEARNRAQTNITYIHMI